MFPEGLTLFLTNDFGNIFSEVYDKYIFESLILWSKEQFVVVFAEHLAKILLETENIEKKTLVNRDGTFLRAIVFPTIFKCMLEYQYAIIKNF